MNFARTLISLALMAAVAAAQAKTQEQLIALRDEKLGKRVFTLAEWTADFDAAMAASAETGKPILAYFTRSYAHCGPCDSLESGMLSSPEFQEFAKSVVLFVHVTSHVEGEQHPHLLREKGFVSFPSLCFMDADGRVTVRAPQRDVASLGAVRARLGELAELRDLAAEGDVDASRRLFLCEIELDMLTAAQIQEHRNKFELDEEETARVEQALVDLEVRAMRARSREIGADAIGKRLAEIAREGRAPSTDSAQFFWQMTLNWCAKNGDSELAQQAFDQLEGLKGPPQMRERNRQLLEQAKAGKK